MYQYNTVLIHRSLLPTSTVWSPVALKLSPWLAVRRSSQGCPPQETHSPLYPKATDFYLHCNPQLAPGLRLSDFFVRTDTWVSPAVTVDTPSSTVSSSDRLGAGLVSTSFG